MKRKISEVWTPRSLSDRSRKALLSARIDPVQFLDPECFEMQRELVAAGLINEDARLTLAGVRSLVLLLDSLTETITKKVVDLIAANENPPLPLSVIPNYMGINLVSVDAVSWTKHQDGQLVILTIHFIPVRHPPR